MPSPSSIFGNRLVAIRNEWAGGGTAPQAQAQAQAPAAASVQPAPSAASGADDYSGKTWMEMVVNVLPQRLNRAESYLKAGDREAANADLAFVQGFTEKHRADLEEFANFRGSQPLGRAAAKSAMGLLTQDYMARFTELTQDPEVRRRGFERDAARLGGGPAMAKDLFAADQGDASAKLRMSAYSSLVHMAGPDLEESSGTADPRARRSRPGVGFGGVPVQNWNGYAQSSAPLFTGGLSEAAVQALGDTGLVQAQTDGFTSGDAATGGTGARLAAKAAREVAGRGGAGRPEAAALLSTMSAFKRGVQAFGGTGDARRANQAASVLSGLQELLPANAFADASDALAQTMSDVRKFLDSSVDQGIDVPDSAAVTIGRALYLRDHDVSGVRPNTPEAAVLSKLSRGNAFADLVKSGSAVAMAGLRAGEPAPQAQGATGLDIAASAVSDFFRGVGKSAAASGEDVDVAADASVPGLAKRLDALGVHDADESLALARWMTESVKAGHEINFANLSDLFSSDPGARQRADRQQRLQSAASDILAANPSLTRAQAEAQARGVVDAPAAAAAKAAPAAPANTPEDTLVSELRDMGAAGSLAPVRFRTAAEKGLTGVAGSLLAPGSRAAESLLKETTLGELTDPKTLARISEAAVSDYEAQAPTVFGASDRRRVESAIRAAVEGQALRIRQRILASGVTDAAASPAAVLGSQASREIFAQEAPPSLPSLWATGYSGVSTEPRQSLVQGLAEALLPQGADNNAIVSAKNRLLAARQGQRKPAAEPAPAAAAPAAVPNEPRVFIGGDRQLQLAENGAKRLHDFLARPIADAEKAQFIARVLPTWAKDMSRSRFFDVYGEAVRNAHDPSIDLDAMTRNAAALADRAELEEGMRRESAHLARVKAESQVRAEIKAKSGNVLVRGGAADEGEPDAGTGAGR